LLRRALQKMFAMKGMSCIKGDLRPLYIRRTVQHWDDRTMVTSPQETNFSMAGYKCGYCGVLLPRLALLMSCLKYLLHTSLSPSQREKTTITLMPLADSFLFRPPGAIEATDVGGHGGSPRAPRRKLSRLVHKSKEEQWSGGSLG